MYGTSTKSHSLDILQIICICLFLSRRVRVMSNVWKSFFFNHYVRNVPLAKKVHQNLVILIDWLPHIQVVHCVHWEEWNNSFFLARISDKVITITHQSLNTTSTCMPTNINASKKTCETISQVLFFMIKLQEEEHDSHHWKENESLVSVVFQEGAWWTY